RTRGISRGGCDGAVAAHDRSGRRADNRSLTRDPEHSGSCHLGPRRTGPQPTPSPLRLNSQTSYGLSRSRQGVKPRRVSTLDEALPARDERGARVKRTLLDSSAPDLQDDGLIAIAAMKRTQGSGVARLRLSARAYYAALRAPCQLDFGRRSRRRNVS